MADRHSFCKLSMAIVGLFYCPLTTDHCPLLPSMPVPTRLLPHADRPAQIGQNGFKIGNYSLNALCFRAQTEHLLLEIQIERQGSGEMVGEGRVFVLRQVLFRVSERQDLPV